MKIGVISDTHDNIPVIKKIFKHFEDAGIRNVIHLGDIISPFVFKFIREVYTGNLYAVFGNNDGEKLFLKEMAKKFNVALYKAPHILKLNGKTIAMMHEPLFIEELPCLEAFDVIAFGHTHEVVSKKIGKTLLINPGEACGYLTGRSTYVELDLDTLEINLEELNERS